MDPYTERRQDNQVRRVQPYRQQVLDDPDLCLTKLLPQKQIEAALERHQVRYRKRLYTPLVTIWTFLYQVLAADQSCRAAVARLLARLCVGKKGTGSAKTDPYCRARQGNRGRTYTFHCLADDGTRVRQIGLAMS